jgi:hypothetical protein
VHLPGFGLLCANSICAKIWIFITFSEGDTSEVGQILLGEQWLHPPPKETNP